MQFYGQLLMVGESVNPTEIQHKKLTSSQTAEKICCIPLGAAWNETCLIGRSKTIAYKQDQMAHNLYQRCQTHLTPRAKMPVKIIRRVAWYMIWYDGMTQNQTISRSFHFGMIATLQKFNLWCKKKSKKYSCSRSFSIGHRPLIFQTFAS